MGKLKRANADAVLIDEIVDDDAVHKSRAHFMLLVDDIDVRDLWIALMLLRTSWPCVACFVWRDG